MRKQSHPTHSLYLTAKLPSTVDIQKPRRCGFPKDPELEPKTVTHREPSGHLSPNAATSKETEGDWRAVFPFSFL